MDPDVLGSGVSGKKRATSRRRYDLKYVKQVTLRQRFLGSTPLCVVF
jgi:hypothetical protein